MEGARQLLSKVETWSKVWRARRNNRYAYRHFETRDDDIFIVSYPKSGTTLVQMMVHQLMTDGEMDFGHVDDIQWFIEKESQENGLVLANRAPSPRIFKTHFPHKAFRGRKGRYLYVVRHGLDVATSYYYHHLAYVSGMRERGVTFDAFFEAFMAGRVPGGNWASHVKGWLANEHGLETRVLFYDDIISDKRAALHTIAEVCGRSVDAAALERAVERTSVEYMRRHQDKFDTGPKAPGSENASFVRLGRSNDYKNHVSREQYVRFCRDAEAVLGADLLARFGRYLVGEGLG